MPLLLCVVATTGPALAAPLVAAGQGAAPPARGKYPTEHHNVYMGGFVSGILQTADIYFPSGVNGSTFPVITFAHGVYEGGPINDAAFSDMLSEVASHGYFVVATDACAAVCLLELFAKDQMHAIDVIKGHKNPVRLPVFATSTRADHAPPRCRSSQPAREILRHALRSYSSRPTPPLASVCSATRGAPWRH